jgi:cytosine/adenosine deaminase-related metal-dependent hydrolase
LRPVYRSATGRLSAGRAFPFSEREQNLLRALDKGVDVVGGIPHFERTMADGAASVTRLCRDRG